MTAPSDALSHRALKHALADIQNEDTTARFETAQLLSHDPAAFIPLRSLLRVAARPEIRHPIVYALRGSRTSFIESASAPQASMKSMAELDVAALTVKVGPNA